MKRKDQSRSLQVREPSIYQDNGTTANNRERVQSYKIPQKITQLVVIQ